jgi:hypothetical protein
MVEIVMLQRNFFMIKKTQRPRPKRFECLSCPKNANEEEKKLELSDFVQLLCSDSRDYQSSSGMQTMKLPCLIETLMQILLKVDLRS